MNNGSSVSGGQQLLVIHPRHLDDAEALIQAVRENQAVVLDASSAEGAEAQRLIDFACGAMEAINGRVHRIDAETFQFTPGQARVENWPLAV